MSAAPGNKITSLRVLAVKKEPVDENITMAPFELKPEWSGPCARADVVDVNLGNAPATFVRAAHCQVTGQEPPGRPKARGEPGVLHDSSL